MPYVKKSHCKRGHEFTPENTRVDTRGARVCRKCKVDWANNKYIKVKNPRTNQNDQKTHCIRGHEFTPENTRIKGDHRMCKDCNTIDQRVRQRKRIGWSEERFDRAVKEQKGRCAICFITLHFGKDYQNARACADHNHITGEPRGVLCNACNSALGRLKDSLDIVKSAAVYLEKYGG